MKQHEVSKSDLNKYALGGLIIRIRAERRNLQNATTPQSKQRTQRALNKLTADYYSILTEITRFEDSVITMEMINSAMKEKVYFTKQEIIELSTTNHLFKLSELLDITESEYERTDPERNYEDVHSAVNWVIDKGLFIDDSDEMTQEGF